MLLDTDILIWVFRGNRKAAGLVDGADDRMISTISFMELVQRARNRQELRDIKGFLSDMAIQVIPLSENIGHRAAIYVEEYGLKMRLCGADALIAATAVEHNLTLCTGNRKHYRPIKDLDRKAFRP